MVNGFLVKGGRLGSDLQTVRFPPKKLSLVGKFFPFQPFGPKQMFNLSLKGLDPESDFQALFMRQKRKLDKTEILYSDIINIPQIDQ